MLVRCKHLASISIFIHRTFCHKYSVVITLTKNKCGKNDIDNIKLHSKQRHNAQYPQPAHCHRDKRQQRQLKTTKG